MQRYVIHRLITSNRQKLKSLPHIFKLGLDNSLLRHKQDRACNRRRREGSGNLWGCLSYVMRLYLEHDYETVRLF